MKIASNKSVLKFELGEVVVTPAAVDAFNSSAKESLLYYLARHATADWGDVCDSDKKLNDEALINGGRLMSSYRLKSGAEIWLITEADRSVTTLLLPSDY